MKFNNFTLLISLANLFFDATYSNVIYKRDDSLINSSNDTINNSVKAKKQETKRVKFTYYWIAFEADFPRGSEKAVIDCNTKKTIAKVSKKYWDALHLEGSGTLYDGTQINCGDDSCNCFFKSPPVGSTGLPLKIYASLAIVEKNYKEGTKIFIKEFEKFKLPNGKTHNGCFLVVDSSWSFGGNHIDLYVEREKNYNKIQETFDSDYVMATYNADCKVLSYSS